MAEATDKQMQQYANERVRPMAELVRALEARAADDKASIEDVYTRAAGANPWTDVRTDGPPHLLDSQSMLQYNSFIAGMIAVLAGTVIAGRTHQQTIEDLHGNWLLVKQACVRPVPPAQTLP